MKPIERFESNKGLVIFCVNRLKNIYSTDRMLLEDDDVIQMGFIGLWKACVNFKEEYNLKFSTYAVPSITGEIINMFRDSHQGFKVPRKCRTIARKLHKIVSEGHECPSIEEIQKEFDCTEKQAINSLEIMKLKKLSMEKPTADKGGTPVYVKDVLKDNFNIEEYFITNERINNAFKELNDVEKKVINLSLENYTQNEIANILGYSQAHVSRIYKKALGKLKNYYEVIDNENKLQFH